MRPRTIALLAVAALGVGACGESEDNADLPPAVPAGAAPTTPTATTPAQTTTAAAGGTPTAAAKQSGISTDTSSKPSIPKPSGKKPTKLVSTDIVKGKGATAKAGDTVDVHYVGVLFSTGKQFDASWDSETKEPFSFVHGQGQVTPGWDEGVAGMKAGGRRLLTIPPDLAYGKAGQGSIGPNATLVFVVDLLKVTPG